MRKQDIKDSSKILFSCILYLLSLISLKPEKNSLQYLDSRGISEE